MTQKKLRSIYKLFDLWAKDFSFACQPGCSGCCTQSVAMTLLEGELIIDYIKSEKPELLDKAKDLPFSKFIPLTTNQFAAACLAEEMLAETDVSWNLSPCLFLENDHCQIYPVRSFMCRSMGSRIPCDNSGEAEMDPLFLTLNTLVLQCIEHLDRGRPWGNMHTILKIVSKEQEIQTLQDRNLRISQPIPGFLVPPAEMRQIDDKLRTLLRIVNYP
jgi:Fe-S-cluster containining protein